MLNSGPFLYYLHDFLFSRSAYTLSLSIILSNTFIRPPSSTTTSCRPCSHPRRLA